MGINFGGAFGNSTGGAVANAATLGGGWYGQLFGGIGGSGAPDLGATGGSDLSQFGDNPNSSPLVSALQNMPGFTPVTAQGSTYQAGPDFKYDAYKAKDMSQTALPQYDAMRARLNSQYSQTQSQAQDALDRQFATMGGGPGGAAVKQTENLASGIAKQKGDDLQTIGAQEAQSRQDLQNQENQKEFQSGEAGKGYSFQAGQADINRKQQADEAAAGRGLSANEFNQQMQQNQNQFGFQAGSTIAGLNTSWDQAQAESRNNEFNKALADWQAKHTGGLLGSGGFLGFGI